MEDKIIWLNFRDIFFFNYKLKRKGVKNVFAFCFAIVCLTFFRVGYFRKVRAALGVKPSLEHNL
jgi:hypothetical protein